MIKKIKKIKNLGIFDGFNWNLSSEFKRYNLFYGWNASGKTTLTTIFESLNLDITKYFEDAEYEIETDNGNIYKQNDIFPTKVRVFNQHYIDENIHISNGKTKPIFLLGEESKELKQKINNWEEEEIKLKNIKIELKKEKEQKEKDINNIFTNIARIIGENLSGSSVRSYRRNNAKDDFEKLAQKELLSQEDLAKYKKIKEQKKKEKIDEIVFTLRQDKILEEIKNILKKSVNSIIIARLKNNPDISAWVEEGIEIHKKHNSKTCEFCGQSLPNGLIEKLLLYFNEEDKKLKQIIDEKINFLNNKLNELNNLNIPKKVELYDDLYNDFESRLSSFNKERINLSNEISELIKHLQNKKFKTNEPMEITFYFNNSFDEALKNLNEIIKKHNNKTENLQEQKDEAFKKIKNHYLSEIWDKVKENESEISEINKIITIINNGGSFTYKGKNIETIETIGLSKLNNKILEAKAKISDLHKSVDKLNKYLETFLGRNEIKFKVSDEQDGFIILRNNEIVSNLSEGEKTAIAFVYFIIHLQDKDFNINNGIVVVDDPVSSFDSSSVFQAFAFMKEAVKDAKQIFIFTHNFDFFKLTLNWFKNSRRNWSCYQIKNKMIKEKENTKRIAYIDKIDHFIEKYTTEYEYLFKVLYEFNNSDPSNIEDVYNIPNIGRKVLETFLTFRIPTSESLYQKLQKINFDENKKTSIYKFFNDLSHLTGSGFHPSLIQESKKNVKYLLEMIKSSFKEHYDILENTLSNQN